MGGTGEQTAAGTFDRSRAPEPGPPPPVRLPEISRAELTNGVPVLVVECRDPPLVSLELVFGGGASAHGSDRAGLAALTADMLDEGSDAMTALDVADAFDRLGARFATGAGYDASSVRVNVLRNRLDQALDLVAAVVRRPSFPEAELERVRRERVIRIHQGFDDPARLADDALASALYGSDDPYGAPLPGTTASLEALGRDDVAGFWEEVYHRGNATVVAVGDIEADSLMDALEARFGSWRSADAPDPPAPRPIPRTSGTAIVVVDKPGAAQSEIRVGRVSAARDTEDYHALLVLNTVLGGAFTSRLNQRLREDKGYTYGARSAFTLRRRPSPFVALAAVHTPVTHRAVVEFTRVIELLAREPVPEEELERARSYLALRLPRQFATTDAVTRRISELVQTGMPVDGWEGFSDGVRAVRAAHVRTAARDYLGLDGMVIVVAGDREAVEGPLRALGLGPVTVLPTPPA